MKYVSRSNFIVVTACSICFILSAVTVFSSSLRKDLREKILGTQRRILSTAVADLMNNGQYIKVVKYQVPEGLFLEFYQQQPDHNFKKIWKTKLSGNQDGYFQMKGRTINLAIDDIDNDNRLEILAPSFNDNLIAHLNIFRYNKDLDQFEHVRPF